MNQTGEAPNSHHAPALRFIQVFGFIIMVLGFCLALAAAANLMLGEGWPMTWILIPIGITTALVGLILGRLAQRIWDIVYYFVSL